MIDNLRKLVHEVKKIEEHPKMSSAGLGVAIFELEKDLKKLKEKHNLVYQIQSLHDHAKK
jgi:hypothetical protein